MRITFLVVGWICVMIPTPLLLYVGAVDWFFRDGMGPKSVSSTGAVAFSRFWRDFQHPFLYGFPIIVLGAVCLCIGLFAGRRRAQTLVA